MNSECDKFVNPENLPIEKVVLKVSKAGVIENVKALDPHWAERRPLTLYERPPVGSALVLGALDAWRTKMEWYLQDLKWLLAMEHHKFWSTVVHYPTCMDMLVSFLQEASPPYSPPYEDRVVRDMYADIRRCVLIVFSRLITNKESKSHWMSKEQLSSVIYDHFIFTIPILWDICLVYGVDNAPHVGRLVSSVFQLQPKYKTDLDAALAFVKEAFKYIIIQVNKTYDLLEPPNLPETFKGFRDIKRPTKDVVPVQEKLDLDSLRDLVVHLLDTALTIRVFVEVYPKCIEILKERGFILSIVQLYENAIPCMYERLQEVGDKTSVRYVEVQGYIDAARVELIDIFKEVLAVSKNAILCNEGNVESHVADYFTTIMDGMSEKLFMKDYHASYPVDEDLEMLKLAYPNIDNVKTDFILQAVYSNLDEPMPNLAPSSSGTSSNMNGHAERIINNSNSVAMPNVGETEIPDSIKEQSLISEVRDILPHLGDGFILKCLHHYGFNSERVINSILEGTLAEPLKALDQSLPIIPEDPVDKQFLNTGIERLNVFDGDQFDVMTRDDIDTSRVHVGKRKAKLKDLRAMLNDKSEVKQRMDIYSKYNMVSEMVEAGMYSDEYDDTYDEEGVAAGDSAQDERRPLVVPRVLRQRDESSSEEEEEVTEQPPSETRPTAANSRVDFCTNPEIIRQRREANFRMRGKPGRPPPRSADVVGKAKGQGQEKEVLINRERKNQNKSARGNHSRRQGAQWKRTQGMMPS